MSTELNKILTHVKSAFDKTYNIVGSEKRRILAARDYLKRADYVSNTMNNFERAFGAVAYTYLQEKAPGLLPYVVGFQLLDKDEDGEKGSGVFIAKINDKIVDVPMFFINNELKGHVLMRLRNPNLFLPLRESFVDYLFSRMPQDLGDPSSLSMSELPHSAQPDMQVFDPVHMLKQSSAVDYLEPWAKAVDAFETVGMYSPKPLTKEVFEAIRTKKASRMIVDLQDVFMENPVLFKAAKVLALEFPGFAAKMNKGYGDTWVADIEREFELRKSAAASLKLAEQEGDLRLSSSSKLSSISVYDHVPPFTDAEEADNIRSEIYKWGCYIADKRAEDQTSMFLDSTVARVIESDMDLESPSFAGSYDVLMRDGKYKSVMVVPGPRVVGLDNRIDLIVDASSKKAALVSRNDYVAKTVKSGTNTEPRLAWNETFKKLSSRVSAGIGVFISPAGQASVPVSLRNKVSKDSWDAYDSAYKLFSDFSGASTHGTPDVDFNGINKVRIYETENANAEIFVRKDELVVPSNAKFIKFSDSDSMSSDDKLPVQQTASLSFQELVNMSNVKLTKHSDDRFVLNGANCSASQVRNYLVFQAQLPKTAAEYMIDQGVGTKYYVVSKPGQDITLAHLNKTAQFDEPTLPFPNMRNTQPGPTGNYAVSTLPDEEDVRGDFNPTRQPMQEGETPEERLGLDLMSAGGMPAMGQDGGIDDGLFDVSGLTALLKATRIDSQLRTVSKSLINVIDQLGQVIFLFYANPDAFQDYYGETEMADLEDSLISNFESLGDLFISLTRRSAEPDPLLDISTLKAENFV